MSRYAHLAYTDSVRHVQEEQGSARAVGRALAGPADEPDLLGEAERGFIASRDGFYLGSVSETGWPYIQYRGGPQGFVHVLDERTLAFADVRGNRQYITVGNVREDRRVALFFMDYARQARLKILGRAEVKSAEEYPALARRLEEVRTDGRVERLLEIRVEGLAWNCHQHITPRYTAEEVDQATLPLRRRLAELEEENARLRARLDH
ncbi:pyridoxamine 5'-phosphate oxidase family protein [Kitasatospora mediocidica]|uniref:pyridoxamine 5'-phosphate oxidase family protein n=1 Tax=Kitasatospora mediocidica TaxID=58352 RepID=UPI00055F1057|nr:pyridoxamine 5'-phosphate oxidase family protein [Kitasatospora mediocidica]